MTTIARTTFAVALLLGVGCTVPLGDSTVSDQADDLVDALGSGKADGHTPIEVALGDSYAIDLETLTSGEATAANVAVFRFSVQAGQSFAVVMRRADGGSLHAYLSLHDGDGRLTQSQFSQGMVPMAAEEDGLLIHTAQRDGELLLVAADREFEFTGTCQVDFLLLPNAPPIDMTTTGPGPRAYMEEMRRAEAELMSYHAAGTLEEGPDGLLVADLLATASLAERVQLQRFTKSVNSLRQDYFEYFVENAVGSSAVGSVAPSVGSFCGQVWRALRSADHRL